MARQEDIAIKSATTKNKDLNNIYPSSSSSNTTNLCECDSELINVVNNTRFQENSSGLLTNVELSSKKSDNPKTTSQVDLSVNRLDTAPWFSVR
jgi:hypothetical protein